MFQDFLEGVQDGVLFQAILLHTFRGFLSSLLDPPMAISLVTLAKKAFQQEKMHGGKKKRQKEMVS